MKLTTETKDQVYTTEFKNMDVSLEQLFSSIIISIPIWLVALELNTLNKNK